eukprot:9372185-Prorocentrum_lima.AAC.1
MQKTASFPIFNQRSGHVRVTDLAATESMQITHFNPMSAGSLMRQHAINVWDERTCTKGSKKTRSVRTHAIAS